MKRNTDRFLPGPQAVARALDREQAEGEANRLGGDSTLQQEVESLRREGTLPPMAPQTEKREYYPAQVLAQPVVGSLPLQPVRLNVPSRTGSMQTDSPAEHAARRAETARKPRRPRYAPQDREAALRQSRELFASARPGSEAFAQAMALCDKYDLPMPAIDIDAVDKAAVDKLAEDRRHDRSVSHDAALPALPKRSNATIALVIALIATVGVSWLVSSWWANGSSQPVAKLARLPGTIAPRGAQASVAEHAPSQTADEPHPLPASATVRPSPAPREAASATAAGSAAKASPPPALTSVTPTSTRIAPVW